MKILDRCKQITDTESGRVLLYRDEVEAVLTAGDTISRQVAIKKRSPQERLIIAKTLIESVLDELPSVQPTQLNTPNTLEALDCISRQAAIDALEKIPVREFKKTDGLLDALVSIGQVYMALKQLPSAQSQQVTGKLNSDCISRRQVISALEQMRNYYSMDDCPNVYAEYKHVIDKINSLPSAQPERKPGKWTKLAWKAYRCSECERISEYYTDFCPNCGSYNGGEQDE